MLLTAKYVIPITSSYIEDGAVLVRGEEIADVGSASELAQRYPDEEVRDFGLAAIMPGFVDTHTHLGYTVLRGLFDDLPYAEWKREVLRCEPFFSAEDWAASARLGTLETVASGITTIADITSSGCSYTAAKEIGLRARIYREVLTTQNSHVEDAVQAGIDDIEKWASEDTSGLVDFGLAPGPIYACHPKVFAEIASYANATGVPVAMHVAGSYEEDDFIRYGSSPFGVHASESEHHQISQTYPPWLPAGTSSVAYINSWGILDVPEVLCVHCVHVDDKDIAILKERNASIAFCPRINSKLSMGMAPVVKFASAGLTVGLGTDSPAAVDTTDMIDEMRIGLMGIRANSPDRRIHVSSSAMLHMATIGAAKALHMDDKIGSLDVGKKADIIAVDLHNSHQNPTSDPESAVIYTANQDNVEMTMVNGRVLYDNFVHVSGVDRDGIVEQARQLRKRIRESASDEGLRESLVSKATQDRQDRYNR